MGTWFMNKISMSQTCLYNFSYKKATRFIQHSVATEGIGWHNRKFATVHSQVTIGSCSMDFENHFLCQYELVSGIVTEVHGVHYLEFELSKIGGRRMIRFTAMYDHT